MCRTKNVAPMNVEETQNAARPRLLIITASVGAGHNAVARAIIDRLNADAPEIEIDCVDAMGLAPWLFRKYYAGGFAMAMSHFPRCYGLGFHLCNRPQKPGRHWFEKQRIAREYFTLRRLRKHILDNPADLILHTHFIAPPIINRMMQKRLVNTPQAVVVTDIEVHRWWYSEGVAGWFVPNEYSAGIFHRWGIDSDLTVSGIPIHPKWTLPVDRHRVLADWNLPAERPIIALTGGTEFTCGPVVAIARDILKAVPHAHLAVLAGRNKKLLARLSALPEAGSRLTPVGYTDKLHELVSVSSLMVTKAGGITTAECLSKGRAMILLKPVPGQEGGNAEYFQRQGAAVIARKYKDVPVEATRLLGNPDALDEMSRKAASLYRPATQTVADWVREFIYSRLPRRRRGV